jgi:hypothetical protein
MQSTTLIKCINANSNNTVFYTVLSGVLIYILGQIINKFIIDPIQHQKETFGKISDALIFYANIYTSPTKEGDNLLKNREEAQTKFRNLACELISKTHQIPLYKLLSWLKLVLKKENIISSEKDLIGLSNGMWPSNTEETMFNVKKRKDIEKKLKLLTKQ